MNKNTYRKIYENEVKRPWHWKDVVFIIEKFASSNTPVFRPEIQNETVEE